MTAPENFLKDELEELKEVFQRGDRETNFGKGIARHPWLLLGLLSVTLTSMGVMLGQLSSADEREHAEFRRAIDDMRKWVAVVDRKVDSQERRLADYGDDSKRALMLMEELTRENYQHYKAAAQERGDTRSVVRLNRKLQALQAQTGGTP